MAYGKGGGFHSFLEKARKWGVQLNCLYTNECNLGNTWEELEVHVQSQT